MENIIDKCATAREYHARGLNCAQCVAMAFAKETNMDEKTLMKLSEAFGAGCGSMRGMCGALSGAIMICGLKNSSGNVAAPSSKASTYAIAKEITNEFEKTCGSLICAEIKGLDTGIPKTSCDRCIEFGIELVGKYLMDE